MVLAAALWLGMANSSSAEQYALTNWNGTEVTLVDLDSVRPVNGKNRFWAISYNAPLEAQARQYEYIRALYEVDCREMKISLVQITTYDRNNKVIKTDNGEGAEMYIVPSSVAQFMVSPICTPTTSKHYYIGKGGWSDPLMFARELISSVPNPNANSGDR